MEQRATYNGKALAGGVSLPADLWKALKARAAAEERPISVLVRRAVIRELAEPQAALARNEREAASLSARDADHPERMDAKVS